MVFKGQTIILGCKRNAPRLRSPKGRHVSNPRLPLGVVGWSVGWSVRWYHPFKTSAGCWGYVHCCLRFHQVIAVPHSKVFAKSCLCPLLCGLCKAILSCASGSYVASLRHRCLPRLLRLEIDGFHWLRWILCPIYQGNPSVPNAHQPHLLSLGFSGSPAAKVMQWPDGRRYVGQYAEVGFRARLVSVIL